jgi:hypothetical protein
MVCWLESPQFLPGKQVGIGAPSPAMVCWLESPQFLPGKQVGIGAPSPGVTVSATCTGVEETKVAALAVASGSMGDGSATALQAISVTARAHRRIRFMGYLLAVGDGRG